MTDCLKCDALISKFFWGGVNVCSLACPHRHRINQGLGFEDVTDRWCLCRSDGDEAEHGSREA